MSDYDRTSQYDSKCNESAFKDNHRLDDLTIACMRHYSEAFIEHCDELETLRWFRDQFASKKDIIHYYEIAPAIVESINLLSNSSVIYECIYRKVILPCFQAIKNGDSLSAYERYKDGVLALEASIARPVLTYRFLKVLKSRANKL